MGIAAYNRGSALLSRQIAAEMSDHHAMLFADLNAARKGTAKLLRDTCIRIDSQGRFWLMDEPETGWASYGRPYGSLRGILEHYAVYLVGLSRDEHGTMIPVLAL